jgi:hypothetical protein
VAITVNLRKTQILQEVLLCIKEGKRMSNRTRPQISFNLDNQLERTLYEKVKEVDSTNFSNAVKYILFAYFFPPGGNHNQAQKDQLPIVAEPEEQYEELEGLPIF